VEVVFLNRELGRSPEDDLLLQVQGMMAEYERAKIVERHRRGKLHAARAGVVHVLSGAPYGYRYVDKHTGGGQARYEIVPDEARVVRHVFDWVGRDRLSIGEVCRRLTHAGEVTRTGKTVWDRSVVWGVLKNPAYMGAAAFGKTRHEPLRPRLRAQRGRPLQPRRAVSISDVPPEEWRTLAVPAVGEADLFAAVHAQRQENQRHARQSRRGARYLLQGLGQCHPCGDALYGKPISRNAAKGPARTYAYYRCLGTDADRFGGERVCSNPQVRTDLLDVAVWHEVCELLAHPERLAEEYRHRLHAPGRAKRQEQPTLEAQIGKLRQGLARLIDSYAEGLIDKQEFEPRITRLRQRLTALEEQAQQLQDDAALHTELRLIIGRLEDFAAQVHDGLTAADWTSKRELIRALVKRVEVTQDQVNVVFRVDQHPANPDPGKKVCNFVGGVASPLLSNLFLHYAFDRWMQRTYPHLPFERDADEAIVHCRTETEAQEVRRAIAERMQECRLELHPDKTKIVYCKDDDRRGTYPNEQCDFLGSTFRPRRSKNWQGKFFINFRPAVADQAGKAMRAEMRSWQLHWRSDKSIEDLSRMFNPKVRGWLQYSGR
ncbi:MAG TPA: recombinase family protein, partial [Candidatus Saccharimonadia bacterium]|nr:recombinase family protein [Candidatus Saccharimonadia bacterium]